MDSSDNVCEQRGEKEAEVLIHGGRDAYGVPKWSGKSPHKYVLVVIKNGVEIEMIPIFEKEWYLIGRAPVCDITLAHESVSRMHFVLQHHRNGQVFVFDLSSTHGVMQNRKILKPRQYYPLTIGDVIHFGNSSRFFVLGLEKSGTVVTDPALTGPLHLAPSTDVGENKKRKKKDVSPSLKQTSGVDNGDLVKSFLEPAPVISQVDRDVDWGQRPDAEPDEDDDEPSVDAVAASDDDNSFNRGVRVKRFKGGPDESVEDLLEGGVPEDAFSGAFSDDEDDMFGPRAASTLALRKSKKARSLEDLEAELVELRRRNAEMLDELKVIDSQAEQGRNSATDDPLDAYMKDLGYATSIEHRDLLKTRIQDVNGQVARLERLVSLAQPAFTRLTGVRAKSSSGGKQG